MARAVILLAGAVISAALHAESLQRDPTLPPPQLLAPSKPAKADAPVDTHVPVLSQIRLRGKDSQAWVDERPLRIGDAVGEARIVAMDIKGITLLKDGVRERLLLAPGITPTPPGTKLPRSPAPAGAENQKRSGPAS